MTSGTGARDRPDGGPRVPRADRPPAAPARPELGGEGFAAAVHVGGPPGSVVASVVLWLTASAAGVTAVVLLWLERAAVRARLADVALAQDASLASDVVADSARYAFLAGAGGVALVAVVHALLALALRTGRSWTRPALLLSGLLGIAVAIAVQDLVADPSRALETDPLRITLLLQAALVLAALAALLTPSAGGWLRRARALQR